MKRIDTFLLIFLTTVLVGMLFGATAFATPKEGGTIRYAVAGEPANLDPPCFINQSDEGMIRSIYDNLVRFAERSGSIKIEPSLSTSWENSSDGLSWTFHLRKEVKFQDGTPFNADAVVFYFKRALGKPKTNKGWPLFGKIVKSAEIVDPYTVKINLKTPNSFFL